MEIRIGTKYKHKSGLSGEFTTTTGGINSEGDKFIVASGFFDRVRSGETVITHYPYKEGDWVFYLGGRGTTSFWNIGKVMQITKVGTSDLYFKEASNYRNEFRPTFSDEIPKVNVEPNTTNYKKGQWYSFYSYKNKENLNYGKFDNSTESLFTVKDWIWNNKYYGNTEYAWAESSISNIKEVPSTIPEIQLYLPIGHIDKIKTVETKIPEYVKNVRKWFAEGSALNKIYKTSDPFPKLTDCNGFTWKFVLLDTLHKSYFEPSTKEAYDLQEGISKKQFIKGEWYRNPGTFINAHYTFAKFDRLIGSSFYFNDIIGPDISKYENNCWYYTGEAYDPTPIEEIHKLTTYYQNNFKNKNTELMNDDFETQLAMQEQALLLAGKIKTPTKISYPDPEYIKQSDIDFYKRALSKQTIEPDYNVYTSVNAERTSTLNQIKPRSKRVNYTSTTLVMK